MKMDEKEIAAELAEKYGIENPMGHLKQIALELLEKYEESEEGLIWEYSGEIEKDTAELKTEVEQYKERVEGLTK